MDLDMADPSETTAPDGKSASPIGLPDFAQVGPHSTDQSGIGVLGDVSL